MWLCLAIASAIFLGVYDVSKKKSLQKNSVMWVLFSICALSTAMLGPFFRTGASGDYLMLVPKAVLVTLSWISGLVGMKLLPLSTVSTIKASRPVFVVLFSILIFGEKLNPGQWAGIAISFTALYMVSVSSRKEGDTESRKAGFLWMGLSVLTGVLSALYDKYVMRRIDPLFVQCWTNLFITVLMGLVLFVKSLADGKKGKEKERFQWDWQLLLTALLIVIADACYFFCLKQEDALLSVVSLIRRGSVIVTFTLSVIIFKEKNIGCTAMHPAGLLSVWPYLSLSHPKTSNMKRIISTLAVLAISLSIFAKAPQYVYTEATDLNLIGKFCPDTPNPYHRVDTVRFKGFTKSENNQMRCTAGMAVLFKTNSKSISILPKYGEIYRPLNATDFAYVGFDLYIMKDGKWTWAGAKCASDKDKDKPVTIVNNMDGSTHECLLYLPIYSELYSVKIGVEAGSSIEKIESPFKGRIGIFGSSFTQGVSCSRAGMSYPMQLQRMTGYQMLSIAASGNCKMQPYFADVICAYDFDAFIFDSFSNPDAKMISERLEPFIKKIRAAHPTEPLIFQQTIYRENRNFDTAIAKREQDKQEMAAKLMKEMCKKYPNVYFIQTNACDSKHEATVDGTHPDDYGYRLWAESIAKPVVKILKKHGIK